MIHTTVFFEINILHNALLDKTTICIDSILQIEM